MPKVDYVWAILAGIAVVLVLSWGFLSSTWGNIRDKASNKEQYDRGKLVFYDGDRWGGKGSNKSCAACHAADFVVEAGVKIEMQEYVAGEPHILKNMSKKHGTNLLYSEDPLFEQVIKCLSNPARMACGPVSRNAKHMQDLMVYVRRQ